MYNKYYKIFLAHTYHVIKYPNVVVRQKLFKLLNLTLFKMLLDFLKASSESLKISNTSFLNFHKYYSKYSSHVLISVSKFYKLYVLHVSHLSKEL